MAGPDVLRLLTTLGAWEAGRGPRYRRLADALTGAAERGALDGMRLPAERRLAEALGISRSTVVRAYALLRERGVAVSRERSGTVVRKRARNPGAFTPLLDRLMDEQPRLLDLSFGAFPLDELVLDYVAAMEDAYGLAPAHGYVPQGLRPLREAIAERYRARGVPTTAEEVLITSGAQEAISLLAQALTGRHQAALVEQTTFSGALEAFARAGAEVHGVEADVAGMRPDALADALARRPAALLYLVPNCHNPTGGHIAPGRRAALLELAAAHGVPVIEDCALDELRHDGPLDPLLQALAPDRVFGLGSISKVAWGGLRLGWLRGPRAEVLRLTQAKGCWDIGAPILDQLVALRVLADHDRLAAARRDQARRRRDALAGALAERLPEWRFALPEGGLSLWVELPPGTGEAFGAVALRHGVAVGAGAANVPGGVAPDHLRICFALPEARLREAVDRLELAWTALRAGTGRGPAMPVAV
jgi:DNA-binding transcriptional MocR family regulator